MLEKLQEKNTELHILSVFDEEFTTFGRVIKNLDVAEIIGTGKTFEMPDGVCYTPSEEAFEKLSIAEEITNELFGTLPTQVGFCYGHNNYLNATEWHTCSEINIAVTDLVLILGHIWDIKDGKIDSSQFKAFYVPEGTAIEVYSTSLHYCPCEVSENGFKCVVALPKDTNTALEITLKDKKVTAKNKWLIAHVDNESKIKQGAVPGITGVNYKIYY